MLLFSLNEIRNISIRLLIAVIVNKVGDMLYKLLDY